jgi:hypothetical protein
MKRCFGANAARARSDATHQAERRRIKCNPRPRQRAGGDVSSIRRKSGRVLGLGQSFEGLLSALGVPKLGTKRRMSRPDQSCKRAVRLQRRVAKRRELFRPVTRRNLVHHDALFSAQERHAKILQG